MKYFLLVVFLLSSCAREIKDNNLKLGTGTANDVVIEANVGNVDNPKLIFDSTDEVWKFSNDGLAFSEVSPPLIIDDLTEKVTPVNDDILLLEDSEDSFEKKKVKLSNLPLPLPNLTIEVTDYTSGSGTYNVPAGTYVLVVESLGGGGGGGRTVGSGRWSGGGGGGGYSHDIINNPSSSYSYSVGAGGAGRTGSTGNGTAGGSSNCAGVIAGGGGGGTGANVNYNAGGVGGSGTTMSGQDGETGDLDQHAGAGGQGAFIGSGAAQARKQPTVNGISAKAGGGGGGSGATQGYNGGNGGSGLCRFTAYIAN